MPQILFKKLFHRAILEGRKTTTLRRWKSCKLRAGDRLTAPGVGVLVVQKVEEIEWESLTEADAVSDGFQTLADLNAMIRKIYPELGGDGKSWFRLKFKGPGAESVGKRRKLASAVQAELDKAVRGKRLCS